MPTTCIIKNCGSGNGEYRKSQVHKSFFSPCTDEMLNVWFDAVSSYTIKPLTKKKKICELHFRAEDIERDFVTKLKDGTLHKLPRRKPLLKKDAVPQFFPNKCIKYTYVIHVCLSQGHLSQLDDHAWSSIRRPNCAYRRAQGRLGCLGP
ncbi:uncharacterized protein LOC127284336 [Leptopilina boulardi]|uniref:uncharacterized protein LOC127284336 n=1 Tax=Leptopilina boulardi TaxID=63433 RepID=UPI0021F58643|nr:uncharacterized protein LOC127284336 [Leptopilina boulardi]